MRIVLKLCALVFFAPAFWFGSARASCDYRDEFALPTGPSQGPSTPGHLGARGDSIGLPLIRIVEARRPANGLQCGDWFDVGWYGVHPFGAWVSQNFFIGLFENNRRGQKEWEEILERLRKKQQCDQNEFKCRQKANEDFGWREVDCRTARRGFSINIKGYVIVEWETGKYFECMQANSSVKAKDLETCTIEAIACRIF